VPRSRAPRAAAALAILASLAACAQTTTGAATDTDAFVRNALDAYGVVDIVPAGPRTPIGEPLDVTRPADAATSLTVEEVCRGRSGPHPRYRDANTGQPIDCGPAPSV